MIDRQSQAGRRLRDRLIAREGTANPALTERYALQNQLLLIDDDLRQAAVAVQSVERFLSDALRLLDDETVSATQLAALAADGEALDQLDALSETVVSLKRRLLALASQIK